jgi:uracil-DNA glycosylase
VRKKIEGFCLPRVERLIDVMRPQRIVSIGFETLDLFGGGDPYLRNDKGRTLMKIGNIAGRKAFATLHLSGARISTIDRNSIRDLILKA